MSFKRYNASNGEDFRTNYVGRDGELTWDSTNGLRLHDGDTVSGMPIEGASSNWTDLNSNVWKIRTYNGGFVGNYDGTNPLVWWNVNLSPFGLSQFRGAIVDYHAYMGNATIVGTIHLARDDGQSITHTETFIRGGDISSLWTAGSDGQLTATTTNNSAQTVMVHWTSKLFYGAEYYC
jgi:hypothetical protein